MCLKDGNNSKYYLFAVNVSEMSVENFSLEKSNRNCMNVCQRKRANLSGGIAF